MYKIRLAGVGGIGPFRPIWALFAAVQCWRPAKAEPRDGRAAVERLCWRRPEAETSARALWRASGRIGAYVSGLVQGLNSPPRSQRSGSALSALES
ncbi:unnamed protein product [Ectocarpus sp. CCAP 1310/34]|nr:unnamed protein product [Ectocarpus sp. CCAP 1310/34]